MSNTNYLDIGAVQRIESGTETIHVNYLDIGAVQRQESVGVAPFFGSVMESMAKRPGTEYGFAAGSLLLTVLATGTVAPFVPAAFDNPSLARIRQAFDVQERSLLLNEAPHNNYDWSNPGTKRAIQQDWVYSSLTNLSAVAVAPFYQTDWPNPVKKKSPILDWAYSQIAIQALPVYAPFYQLNWPNPIPRKPLTAGLSYSPLAIQTAPIAAPFYQTDWPNPVLHKPHRYSFDATFSGPNAAIWAVSLAATTTWATATAATNIWTTQAATSTTWTTT